MSTCPATLNARMCGLDAGHKNPLRHYDEAGEFITPVLPGPLPPMPAVTGADVAKAWKRVVATRKALHEASAALTVSTGIGTQPTPDEIRQLIRVIDVAAMDHRLAYEAHREIKEG